MDANTVIQAISNVGFPIAAFLLMWYQCNTVVRISIHALLAESDDRAVY